MKAFVTALLAGWMALSAEAPALAGARRVEVCPDNRAIGIREIAVTDGDHRLSGSVIFPEGKGPYPVVLMLYGSSKTTRQASGLFPPIWCALARAGVASVAWDRPGAGRSTGDADAQSWLRGDRAREVEAVYRFVAKQPDLDPRRISLLGISQGDWVIAQLLKRKLPVDGVILLSSPVSTVADQTRYTITRQLTYQHADADDVAQADAGLRAIGRVLSSGGDYEQYRKIVDPLQRAPWIPLIRDNPQRDYFFLERADFEAERAEAALDSPPDFETARHQTLVIYGDQDFNVDPVAGVSYFLDRRDRGDPVEIFLLPGVNHFLRVAPHEGLATPARPSPQELAAMPVSDDMLSAIEGWARKRLTR